MFLLKRVEYQMNPNYTDIQELLKHLKRLILYARAYFVMVILLYIMIAYGTYTCTRDIPKVMDFGQVFFFILGPIAFKMNCALMCYFYKMTSFFIEILSKNDTINRRKAKAFIIFIAANIIISNFMDFLITPFFIMINIMDIEIPLTIGVNLVTFGWLQGQITPFLIAFFMIFMI